MRELKEIKEDTRVIQLDDIGSGLHGGYLRLRTGKQRTFSVVVSVADGRWEHVSVSIYNSSRKTPTWEEMCEVKEIFWDAEEEVHQIHPKESQYVHGVGGMTNVLHLWRPVGGWKDETMGGVG